MHNYNLLAPSDILKETVNRTRRCLLGEDPDERPPPACSNLPSRLSQKLRNCVASERQKTSVVALVLEQYTGLFLTIVITDRPFFRVGMRQEVRIAAGCRSVGINQLFEEILVLSRSIFLIWQAPVTSWHVGAGCWAQPRLAVFRQIWQYSGHVDGNLIVPDDATNDLPMLVAKHVAVQVCRECTLGVRMVVHQMKLSLVAIPEILQPRYLRHFAFNADIVGRWDEQDPECECGCADRSKHPRGISPEFDNLDCVKVGHPRQRRVPMLTDSDAAAGVGPSNDNERPFIVDSVAVGAGPSRAAR